MEEAQAAMAPVQPEELMSRTVECRYCGSYRYKVTYYWLGSVIVAEGECGRCGVRGRSFEPGRTVDTGQPKDAPGKS